jgi:type I restriction enzyme S subunit
MSEWKELNLGELLQTKGYIRGPFGSSLKRNEMKEEGVPVYEQRNAIYNERIFRFFIDDTKYQELKRFQVKTNDLIISCSGTVGKVSVIMEDDPKGIISQALLILRPDTKKVVLQFLYYFLTSKKGYELITQASHGSVQVNIAERKVVESIPILLPPLSEQEAIAEVLSSLDDKIDLLHRQNKTLEQLAETLFRQWFVEEADESWEDIAFGEIVRPKKGKNITKAETIEGQFPVVAGGLEPSCYHNEANTKSPVITVSASGANAGFVRLYYTPVWSSDSSFIDETITPYVYFCYVFLRVNQRQLFDKQEGSAQPHIYPSHIMELDCLEYPNILIEKYESVVTPFFHKIKSNTQQIRTLTQLRDSLLPKLMSGEIKIEMN